MYRSFNKVSSLSFQCWSKVVWAVLDYWEQLNKDINSNQLPFWKKQIHVPRKEQKQKQKLFLYDIVEELNKIMTRDKFSLVTFFQEGCIFAEVWILLAFCKFWQREFINWVLDHCLSGQPYALEYQCIVASIEKCRSKLH